VGISHAKVDPTRKAVSPLAGPSITLFGNARPIFDTTLDKLLLDQSLASAVRA